MSTHTDGAPPSVAPESDDDPGRAETAEQAREVGAESEADAGAAWLQEEIQRRIAAARRGSGGRHARHGGPDPAPAPADYRARHATDRPEPLRRRQTDPPSPGSGSGQPAVGDDGADAPTAWARASALRNFRPLRQRADPDVDGGLWAEPGQSDGGRRPAWGAGTADLTEGAPQTDAPAAAPDAVDPAGPTPGAGSAGTDQVLDAAGAAPADAPERAAPAADVAAGGAAAAVAAPSPAPVAPTSDGADGRTAGEGAAGEGAAGEGDAAGDAAALADATQAAPATSTPAAVRPADDVQAPARPDAAEQAAAAPPTAEAANAPGPSGGRTGPDTADETAASTGDEAGGGADPAAQPVVEGRADPAAEGGAHPAAEAVADGAVDRVADPAADAGRSGAEPATAQPVPSTWSGLGRAPSDEEAAPPRAVGSRPDGLGVVGGPTLPEKRPRRRPRAVPLSGTWGRPEVHQPPEPAPSDTTAPSESQLLSRVKPSDAPAPQAAPADAQGQPTPAEVSPPWRASNPTDSPTDSGHLSDVRSAWPGPSSDVAAQPDLRPAWQPQRPQDWPSRPAPPSGPAAARLLSAPPVLPATVAIPTVPGLPATPPSAPPRPEPEPDELDDDLADDDAHEYPDHPDPANYDDEDDADEVDDDDADDGPEGVIWRASTQAPPAPAAAEPPRAPVYPPGKRVRVVLAERKAAARPVRTVVDIQEDGAVGEVLRSGLITSQLRVALGFALLGGLPLGLLPAVFYLFPEIGTVAVFGLRLPWLLIGVLVYPFLFGLGWCFTRAAERVEQDFADHVQD